MNLIFYVYLSCSDLIIVLTTCHFYRLCPEMSGRSVNRILTLVHQANFSEGEFAKLVPLSPLSFFLFLFLFYYGRVGGFSSLLHLFFFVCKRGVLVEVRRNAVVAFLSLEQIMMQSRKLQF